MIRETETEISSSSARTQAKHGINLYKKKLLGSMRSTFECFWKVHSSRSFHMHRGKSEMWRFYVKKPTKYNAQRGSVCLCKCFMIRGPWNPQKKSKEEFRKLGQTTYNPFMESLKRKRLRAKTHWSQGLSSCYQICWAAINLYCKYTVY